MRIVEFILDRIAEDEALAEGALDHMSLVSAGSVQPVEDPIAVFVGRWNPWHVLSLCVLRRQTVMTHRPALDEADRMACSNCDDPSEPGRWPCRSLVLLANEWVDHPDFRPEWTLHRRRMLAAV